jgi:hypothetical protein
MGVYMQDYDCNRNVAVTAREIGEVGQQLNDVNAICNEQRMLIDELRAILEPVLNQNKIEGNSGKASAPEAMLVPLASELRNTRRAFDANNSSLRDIISSIRL